MLLVTVFNSCTSDKSDVDVSNIKVELTAQDFYQDFAKLDTLQLGKSLNELNAKYPSFLNFYLDTLLPFTPVNRQYENEVATVAIKNIFKHKDYVHLTDTVSKVFTSTKSNTAAIKNMLQHVKYHLPEWALPTEVVYFVSYLNKWTCFTNGTTLGVGLDMFLGENFRPYEAVGLPNYALINHSPENIPLWAAKAIYLEHENGDLFNKDLLGMIILNGKEIFYLEKMLPKMKFNLIMGYTPEQMKWCEQNEAFIFNTFLQQNLLFNKEFQNIVRYVSPGPNSAGFPQEAPGNIGTYIGYKILKAYEKKSGLSVKEILAEKDANAIFQKSKYKP